jgi:hypothetical protein
MLTASHHLVATAATEDCKAQFKTTWARTRAGLTEADIAEALSALRSEPRDRRSLAAPD